MLHSPDPSLRSELNLQCFIPIKLNDGFGQLIGVVWFHQETGLTFLNRFWNTTDPAADDRNSTRISFQKNDSKSFTWFSTAGQD